MSVRYQSLTPRQLVVLQWIAEGCPDGTWPDDSHKISARALETRNLATVSRRGGRWHATIKSDGTYYLTHGQYPKEPPPTHDRTESPASIVGSRDEIDVDDLIARLRTGSPIRVEAPTPGVRAAYRRAISAAITGGKVPTGLTLLHTGRDHGNLVISLIEAQPPTPKPAPIPIPNTHDPDQPAIRHLLENGSHWAVSPDARPRAFTLIQALADEATRRGHQVSERHAETSTFRIDIGEDSYPFLLTEEHDKGDQIPQEQLDAAKYSWQRVSLRPAMIPSGRLTLQLQHGSRHPHWADRQRWRLDEKLAAVMEQIEQHAAGARQQREDAAAERARHRQLWEQAVPRAQERYVYDLNAERLLAQAHASAQAEEVLTYCQRLANLAAAEPDPEDRHAIEKWAAWGRAHAKAIDPLSHIVDLRYVEPVEAKAEDLDRYMPQGMTVRCPPDRGGQ